MKQGIHPTYHADAKASCACGNKFTTGSTEESLQTELCSACHPFYTNKQKIVDTARRVERFQSRLQKKKTVGTRLGKKEKRARDVARRKVRAEEAVTTAAEA